MCTRTPSILDVAVCTYSAACHNSALTRSLSSLFSRMLRVSTERLCKNAFSSFTDSLSTSSLHRTLHSVPAWYALREARLQAHNAMMWHYCSNSPSFLQGCALGPTSGENMQGGAVRRTASEAWLLAQEELAG